MAGGKRKFLTTQSRHVRSSFTLATPQGHVRPGIEVGTCPGQQYRLDSRLTTIQPGME